jgi:3-oxoacyl-[acyl-carrier protein] reductase
VGRTVLVTGGGGGVGRGIALACGAERARVVIASPRENGLETAQLIADAGGNADWVRCDVTKRRDVEAVIAYAGSLDALVHNATSRSSSEPHRVEDLSAGLWEEHAAVSLRGAFFCAQSGFRALSAARGSLILMTSPAGIDGSRMLPAYGIVKGALRGFAKSLAKEWAPVGVRVNLVSPLAMTPSLQKAILEDPPLAERLAARVPLGWVGDPAEDIGPAVAFLASDDARYITGQTLVVDGGRFMGL